MYEHLHIHIIFSELDIENQIGRCQYKHETLKF